jgi:hypothetical protein
MTALPGQSGLPTAAADGECKEVIFADAPREFAVQCKQPRNSQRAMT